MKGVITAGAKNNYKKPRILYFLLNFVVYPSLEGVLGFAAFLCVTICAKYAGFLLGTQNSFNIDINDVELSLLGFVLVFLIKFLKNFSDEDSPQNKSL
jgi:hypothetical protein